MLFPGASPVVYVLPGASKYIPSLIDVLGLLFLYLGAFYLVSFWEMYPGTTIKWGKFELIQFAVVFVHYAVGRVCKEQEILQAYAWIATVIISLTIAQIFLDEERIRYGYGWQLMMCLPAALLLRKYWLVVIGLTVMLASRHKSALACAVLGCLIVFIFAKLPPLPRSKPAQQMLSLAFHLTALIFASIAVYILSPHIISTIGRFISDDSTTFRVLGVSIEPEGEDIVRAAHILEAIRILPEHYIKGMGYMNFYEWTTDLGGFASINQYGTELTGITLHNAYLSWVIEGGITVSVVVLFIAHRLWSRIRSMLVYSRNFAVLSIAWFAILLLHGMFHQLHQMMQLWGSIALIYGFIDRKRTYPA